MNSTLGIVVAGVYLQVRSPFTMYKQCSPMVDSTALVRHPSHLRPRVPIHLAIIEDLDLASRLFVEQVHVLGVLHPLPWGHPVDIGHCKFKCRSPYADIQLTI